MVNFFSNRNPPKGRRRPFHIRQFPDGLDPVGGRRLQKTVDVNGGICRRIWTSSAVKPHASGQHDRWSGRKPLRRRLQPRQKSVSRRDFYPDNPATKVSRRGRKKGRYFVISGMCHMRPLFQEVTAGVPVDRFKKVGAK